VTPVPAIPEGCESKYDPEVCFDTDCVERPYGACVNDPFGGCECTYGCATDADCGSGICACGGVVGFRSRCIPASCSASSECGDGLCGLSVDVDPCGEYSARLACHDGAQECRVDADCGPEQEEVWCDYASNQPKHQCRLDGVWSCTTKMGQCGPCG
jgi:hypothetical protein